MHWQAELHQQQNENMIKQYSHICHFHMNTKEQGQTGAPRHSLNGYDVESPVQHTAFCYSGSRGAGAVNVHWDLISAVYRVILNDQPCWTPCTAPLNTPSQLAAKIAFIIIVVTFSTGWPFLLLFFFILQLTSTYRDLPSISCVLFLNREKRLHTKQMLFYVLILPLCLNNVDFLPKIQIDI